MKNARARLVRFSFGGGGEIRTHGPVAQTPVFKTGAFDHSATPPSCVVRLPILAKSSKNTI